MSSFVIKRACSTCQWAANIPHYGIECRALPPGQTEQATIYVPPDYWCRHWAEKQKRYDETDSYDRKLDQAKSGALG